MGLRAPAMHCIAAAFALATLSATTAAIAGPGHSGDEGHAHDGPAATSAQSPRVSATSEAFQLVGILKAGKLTIYLDREPDNAPVSDAKITVSVGGKPVVATATKDGTYELVAGDWAKSGEAEMQFAIAAGGKNDLLGGVLVVPGSAASVAAARPHSHFAALRSHLPPLRHLAVGALLLGFGLVVGNLLARRRSVVAGVAVALITASVALTPSAMAGPGHSGDEGHAHGPEAGAGLSDSASRLPDGSVFVPKPTQRLIEVRTGLASMSEARRHVRLPGRVIASPNGPMVDVALYDQTDPDAIRGAQAIAPSGATAELKLASRGTELKQNALPLTFSIAANAPATLKAVGQRVMVVIETGEPIKGIVLPRAAVVTAPNGQAVVFEHTEPERFTPKLVIFTALDTTRIVVTSGLADGDKVVLQAASLINQVR
jgi:hypothetical protein